MLVFLYFLYFFLYFLVYFSHFLYILSYFLLFLVIWVSCQIYILICSIYCFIIFWAPRSLLFLQVKNVYEWCRWMSYEEKCIKEIYKSFSVKISLFTTVSFSVSLYLNLFPFSLSISLLKCYVYNSLTPSWVTYWVRENSEQWITRAVNDEW